MKNNISNSDDVIDSRDIEERITELESARDDWQEENTLPDYSNTDKDTPEGWTPEQFEKWVEWDESEEGEDLNALYSLRDDLEDYCPDWRYGTTLIRESYWVEYCKDMVEELGELPKGLPDFIESNINWQGVAEDLQQDYTSGEYDGVTYWAR